MHGCLTTTMTRYYPSSDVFGCARAHTQLSRYTPTYILGAGGYLLDFCQAASIKPHHIIILLLHSGYNICHDNIIGRYTIRYLYLMGKGARRLRSV